MKWVKLTLLEASCVLDALMFADPEETAEAEEILRNCINNAEEEDIPSEKSKYSQSEEHQWHAGTETPQP
jgi:hypothetical protein